MTDIDANAQPAPAGWRWVPEEPTEAMIEAVQPVCDALCREGGQGRALWEAMLAASPPPPVQSAPAGWVPTHRHAKRGSTYRVLGEATAQGNPDDPWLFSDGDKLTVYQAEDGRLWVRYTEEFNDGRFEALAASPPPPVPTPAREAEANARIAELERHVEELQDKINPEHGCACSYDRPGDVCAVHSPALAKAEARIAELERDLAAATRLAEEHWSNMTTIELARVASERRLAEAVEAEREACARVAEADMQAPRIWQDGRWVCPSSRDIAAAIRARSILEDKANG